MKKIIIGLVFILLNFYQVYGQIQVAGSWDSWTTHTMESYGTWDGLNLYMYKGITLNSNTQYQYKYVENGTWVGKDSAPNYYLTNSSSYACQASDFYSDNGNAYVNPLLKTGEYVFYYQDKSNSGTLCGYGILKPAEIEICGNFTGGNPRTAPVMSKFSNNGEEWYGYHTYFSKATNLKFKFIQGHTYAGFYWCWSGAGSSTAPVTNATCVRSTVTYTNSITVYIPYAGVWHFYFNPKNNIYTIRQDVMISHFDPDGNGSTANDSIEIYNPNPFPINLNGYRVLRFTSTGTFSWSILLDGYVIPAFGYLLLAQNDFTDVPPDIVDSSLSITSTGQSFGIVIDNDNDPDDGDGYKVDGIGTDAPSDNKLGEGTDFNVGTDGDGYWRISWDTNGNYKDTDDNATDFGSSGTYRDHNSRTLNSWHIYTNNEPYPHRMRETTNPYETPPYNPRLRNLDTVSIWLGIYPQVTVTSATLYYKATNLVTWNSVNSNFITNSGVNRYIRFQYSQPDTSDYDKGDRVAYYIRVLQDSRSNICYICEYNSKSIVTPNEEFAKLHPFKYTIVNDNPIITNLIQPVDGENNYFSRRPKFIWSPAYDRDGDSIINYHIWVSSNANFSDAVVDTDTGSSDPWYQISPILNLNTTYYWRITAYDGTGWGPYSKTNSFVVNPPFITVDGAVSDWGSLPSFPYGDNTCRISNGIWNWSDTNGDVRTDPPNYGNAELLDFRVTADTNAIFFLIKVNGMSDPPLTYVSICIDTNVDDSTSGVSWIAGNSETYVAKKANWEAQFIASLNKTGIFDSSGTYHTAGESWLQPPAAPPGIGYVEAGVKWSDLGFKPPKKLRFTVSLGVDDSGNMYEITGSDVCDAVTITPGNTWAEVSNGTNNHYFDIFFNNKPYSDTHGGHIGLVYPDHFIVHSSRTFTKPGIEFNLTNTIHAHSDGCKACIAENGSIVPDYNNNISHTLTPSPAGDLLRSKSSGFSEGKLVENNVILNQIASPVHIKINDDNITTVTGAVDIVSTRPDIHINEINIMPVGADDNKEWIEIYSKETNTLNLTNWYFTDEDGNGYHITKNIFINKGNFLVLYDGTGTDDTDLSDGRGALYGDWGVAILTPTDDTSTSGDEASFYSSYLSLNENTIIDFVGWDGDGVITYPSDYNNAINAGIWPNISCVTLKESRIDEGDTIALLPSGNDNNSPSDWCVRAFPTPGYSNYLHPVIQEIANSPGGNNYAEYIEIFNPCPYDVDISHWAICDPTSTGRNPRLFPTGTIIKSNGFILVGRNANNFYKVFKFYPNFEWDTSALAGGDNALVTNLGLSYSIAIANDDTFFLVGTNYTTADVSIDEIVIGVGDSGTNYFPEKVWRGKNAPALNTSQALRRIPIGREGVEYDNNISIDTDISPENNEDLSTIFKLTNWDPNADYEYYVSWRYGDDTRTPFEAHHINTPWKTIQHAHDNMIPGDIALILPGTNYESVLISNSGLNTDYITYSGYSNNSFVKGSPAFTVGASYIKIKKLNIIKSGGHGIIINNNAKRCIIRDNNIYSNHYSGIQMTSSFSNYIIDNNIYSNSQCGIDIWAPNSGHIIESNMLYNNFWHGILFRNTGGNNNIHVTYNLIYENSGEGIYMQDYASNILINNNYLTNNNVRGIFIWGPDIIKSTFKSNIIDKNNSGGLVVANFARDNLFSHNTIHSNYWGVYLDSSVNNSFATNLIFHNVRNGFYVINSSSNNSFFSNTIYSNGYSDGNGGQGVYLYGTNVRNNLVYNNIVYNNDYGSTYNDNIKIEAPKNKVYQNNVYSDGNGKGIVIINSYASNNEIYNNYLYTNNYGIWVSHCNKNDINNNTIIKSKNIAIFIQNATNNYFGTNYIYNNYNCGIWMEASSKGNTFLSNYIYNNSLSGIEITINSFKNKLIKNQIYNNGNEGLYFLGGSYSNTIISNKIYNNLQRGIWNNDSYYNFYKDNYCSHNAWQGCTIEGGSINVTFSNNIVVSNANGDSTYGSGILIGNSHNIKILNNVVYSNHPYGINLLGLWGNPSNAYVSENKVFKNTINGIRINLATNIILYNNTIYKCTNGIFSDGYSSYNFIRHNIIYSNYNIGIYFYTGINNTVISNNIYKNKYGIYIINECNNNIIKYNHSYRNSVDGIYLNGSIYNRIINNYTLTNIYNNGITFDSGASNNYCASNISAYNAYGIRLNNTSKVTLFRNAIFRQNGHGIWLTSADNNILYHNSVVSNDIYGNYDNLHIDANSTGNIVKNNIFAYAKLATGYGVNIESGGSAILRYNDVYSNVSGNYGGVAGSGNGSISKKPGFLSYNIYSSNFLYLTNNSLCIDAGTNLGYSYSGAAPDMGWKEFDRPYVRLEVSKSVSNILLGGVPSTSIPGATIFYKISFTITGNTNAKYLIIFDKIPTNTTYLTDFLGTATGWTSEYSTNISPSEIYNSPDFSKVRPIDKNKIKWVRWKKPSQAPTTGTIYYKVIVQ